MFSKYENWIHGQWPAGNVEQGPIILENGRTHLSGVYVVGDLTGVPLLKFALDGGTKVVQSIVQEKSFSKQRQGVQGVYDLAIIGAGVSGSAAALEAKRQGLNYIILEANEPLSTIQNFPIGKPIFTYPTELTPAGTIQLKGESREALLAELEQIWKKEELVSTPFLATHVKSSKDGIRVYGQTKENEPEEYVEALRVVVAIGRSGKFRRLGVPGEELDHVSNRLHDPGEWKDQHVIVIGGGDSAVESAIALTKAGAKVVLSYRAEQLTRPKPENLKELKASLETQDASIETLPETSVAQISTEEITFENARGERLTRRCDAVFTMIGRESPLAFFRRSKIPIEGEFTASRYVGLAALLALCMLVYHWKSYSWFPFSSLNPSLWIDSFLAWQGAQSVNKTSVLYTLLQSARGPSFYFTLVYSLAIAGFGWARIRRRRTPYVTRQTICLILFQWIPLFLLPELLLPWMGRNGFFHDGATLRPFADLFFESVDGGLGEERAYWRAYGFILAWPLMVYNWFTSEPIVGWLVLGFLQTFVIIPLLVYKYGKGAYCSWICSCGGLAETMGDTLRRRMPHGPQVNRLNMLGQLILCVAVVLMVVRVSGWIWPGSWVDTNFNRFLDQPSVLSYKWIVDVSLAGFLGLGLYFHFSGRTWCRFACPLAALMNIYGRFSRFRIFSEKEKCISCNQCTSVCHQGIDVMSFANQGKPMEDPQCVRCSACVQECPTGVLKFGSLGTDGKPQYDSISSSLVQINERPKASHRSSIHKV